MPNYLSSLWGAANTPVIPEAPVRKLQEAMTEPHLDENPLWTRVKGFGAGALEGLRQQATPLGLASLAMPALRGAGAAEEAGAGIRAAAAPTLDLIESSPWQSVRQVAPAMEDVEALTGGLKSTLAKIPSADPVKALRRAYPTAVHNNQAIKDISHPGAQEMMERLAEEARPVYQQLKNQGAFSGDRSVGDLIPSIYRK